MPTGGEAGRCARCCLLSLSCVKFLHFSRRRGGGRAHSTVYWFGQPEQPPSACVSQRWGLAHCMPPPPACLAPSAVVVAGSLACALFVIGALCLMHWACVRNRRAAAARAQQELEEQRAGRRTGSASGRAHGSDAALDKLGSPGTAALLCFASVVGLQQFHVLCVLVWQFCCPEGQPLIGACWGARVPTKVLLDCSRCRSDCDPNHCGGAGRGCEDGGDALPAPCCRGGTLEEAQRRRR